MVLAHGTGQAKSPCVLPVQDLGPGVRGADHDVGQCVAPLLPGAQLPWVPPDLPEPVVSPCPVTVPEHKCLPPDLNEFKSVVAVRISGDNAITQPQGLPEQMELPVIFVPDEYQHGVLHRPWLGWFQAGLGHTLHVHQEEDLHILELQGLAAFFHPLAIGGLGQLQRPLHHKSCFLPQPAYSFEGSFSHLNVDDFPLLLAVLAKGSEGPRVPLLLGFHVDVLQVGLDAALGLPQAAMIWMVLSGGLDDSAEQQWVLSDSLQRGHQEGPQVHPPQCCVVILGDIEEYSAGI